MAYFLLMFFRQSNFLQLVNQLKRENFERGGKDPSSHKLWKEYVVYFHCIIGTAWIPVWNLYRLVSGKILLQHLKMTWNMRVYGINDASEMEELNTWKLIASLIFEIMGFDSMNISVCAVVMVYIVAASVQGNAAHLHKCLQFAEHYYLISSTLVQYCSSNFTANL